MLSDAMRDTAEPRSTPSEPPSEHAIDVMFVQRVEENQQPLFDRKFIVVDEG